MIRDHADVIATAIVSMFEHDKRRCPKTHTCRLDAQFRAEKRQEIAAYLRDELEALKHRIFGECRESEPAQ